MSLLRFPNRTEERMTIDALGALAQASRVSYGDTVDEDSSMRHDAVWSCRTRIAQDISMMPVDVIRYVNGTRLEVNPQPQIIANPSGWTDALDWRYQIVDSWLGFGNTFGLITQLSGTGAYPTRIELLNPGGVTPIHGQPGRFTITGHGEEQLWPLGLLWHVPAYTVAGQVLGMSPIQYHRATIAGGLAAGNYGKGFFDGGGHPTGIIAPGTDPGLEGATQLKQRFMDALNGAREPIVLPKDTTYIPLQTNPTDSQFLDTQRYTVEQICRIFGEDPADHGSSSGGSSITYANRTDADLARYKRRQFWVVKMQRALTALIPRPQQVRLNTSSALMMTTKERHEVHKLRLDSNTITVNEIRRIEDEAPFPDAKFDEPGIATAPAVTPAARAVDERSFPSPQPPQSLTVNMPDQSWTIAVPEQRIEPPVIHVDAPIVNVPEQRMDAPSIVVQVDPTPVTVENTVNVDPTPVTVENNNRVEVAPAKVPPAQVTIMPADEKPSTYRVRRDDKGRISEVQEKD